MSSDCPFCSLNPQQVLGESDLALFFEDKFPVTPGHTLIIPRRHIVSYFEATAAEKQSLWDMVDTVQRRLEVAYSPQGYNIGVNVGEAAGQTVMHLHIHIIPRYKGDMRDPRGGVRHVIPEKGKY